MKDLCYNFYSLLFEDDDMLAVSKNHGVYVIPDRQNQCVDTLFSVLTENFGRIYTVHRLDMGTAGVMIYAKTPDFHRELCLLFENRKVEKTYIAITRGRIFSQTLMLPIAAGGKGRYKINFKSGKSAITSFRTLDYKSGASLIEAKPYTGRTHQIRVHLKALKAPLYYDYLYNSKTTDKRLPLFAKSLSFIHPVTKKLFFIEAPYSSFMKETAQTLELSLKDVY